VDDACADLAAWRAGEAAALERLVRGVTPVLWQLARAHGLEPAGAEAVVAASWAEFVRRPHRTAEPRAALSELMTSVRRGAWLVARTAEHTPRPVGRPLPQLPERCRRMLRVIAFEPRPDHACLAGHLGLRLAALGPARRHCLDRLRALLVAGPTRPLERISDEALLAHLRNAWIALDPAPDGLADRVLRTVRLPRQQRAIRRVDAPAPDQLKSQ
jgi:hypothetical protein